MCLSTVERRLTKKDEKSGKGYKVFHRTQNGRLNGQIMHREDEPYRCRVWYTAKGKRRIHANDGKTYMPGFHIFTKLQDAVKHAGNNAVHLVEYRRARCIGKQSIGGSWSRRHGDCVIAGEMRIIKKVSTVCVTS